MLTPRLREEQRSELLQSMEQLASDSARVFVKGFMLSYHNKETILFTIDPCYGSNLHEIL